jgi:hypothetical protein
VTDQSLQRGLAKDEVCRELQPLVGPRVGEPVRPIPMPDEPFVDAWKQYVHQSRDASPWEVLQKVFVQLAFPVRAEISRDPEYRHAVGRGAVPQSPRGGMVAKAPTCIRFELIQTLAGSVPLVILPDREDFVQFLQSVCYRNEPVMIPPSIGAQLIRGYNNWERFHNARAHGISEAELIANKALYQDTFIVVSEGRYSGLKAESLGLEEKEWQRKSHVIRVSHERAHYVSRRFFGVIPDRITDELIADFSGMVASEGWFSANWFLTMMGLRGEPVNRRLDWYLSRHPVSDAAFAALVELLERSALALESACSIFDIQGTSEYHLDLVTLGLTKCSLWELASPETVVRVLEECCTPLLRRVRAHSFPGN